MSALITHGILGVTGGALLLIGACSPGRLVSADATDSEAKGAIEEIVRDYIKAHPEVIEESLEKLGERRQAEARQRGREAVAANQDDIFRDPDSPVHGNPGGDVTLVEFFDYRCRYCRAVAPVVTQLVKDDPNVRLVYKDFPMLGEASLLASKAALASRAQGKYQVFHEALMTTKAELTEASIMEIAAGVGLDTERLTVDMHALAVMAVIEKNRALGKTLGLSGTPAFVVGPELAPGAMDLSELKEMVAQARAK